MIGERLWLAARETPERAQGSAFDLRAFHANALNIGPMGLEQLQRELAQAYNRRGGAELPIIQIVPSEVERYAAEHTTPLPPLLDELVRETRSRFGSRAEMLCGQVEGQFLQMLVAMSGARRVLEIGSFTGFSALMMAAALPAEAELITLELSAECAEFARGYFARSEHGDKIRLLEGPAVDSLRTLAGPFDFAFIDADKASYPAY